MIYWILLIYLMVGLLMGNTLISLLKGDIEIEDEEWEEAIQTFGMVPEDKRFWVYLKIYVGFAIFWLPMVIIRN